MKRLTLTILASTTAVALGCGGNGSAAADQQDLQNSPVYLALGDSVPFGYNSSVFPPKNDNVFDPTAYPWYLAQMEDIPLVNASCPGQASGGFIWTGGDDLDCLVFRKNYADAMHVDYSDSQLVFAIDYLAAHPRTRFVTITLGANDVQLLVNDCLGDPECIKQGLPGVLQTLGANMATIFGALQKAAGSDPVQIIVANYYSPYPQEAAFEDFEGVVVALNGTLKMVADAPPFQFPTADVYEAFKNASGGKPCAAGLLQRHSDDSCGIQPIPCCGIHPSPAGAQLIAETIAPLVPSWTGKP